MYLQNLTPYVGNVEIHTLLIWFFHCTCQTDPLNKNYDTYYKSERWFCVKAFVTAVLRWMMNLNKEEFNEKSARVCADVLTYSILYMNDVTNIMAL